MINIFIICLSWLAFLLSAIGAIYAIGKNIKCWYVWLGANICWVVYAFLTHQLAILLTEIVFIYLNIYGIRAWRKNK